MGCHSGLRVKDATELQKVHPSGGNRTVMIHPEGIQNTSDNRFRVFCDITSDPQRGWHLVFNVFPRAESPYIAEEVRSSNRERTGTVPSPTDTNQSKVSDADIRTILNNGIKQTRTQWWHTSVEFGTVWGDGSLTNQSTLFNEFDDPNVWNSTGASPGATFRRRTAADANFSGTITSGSTTGCSSAVGGWSNWYEQSCVRSWFAGCEGGPAYNHRCAGAIQDRANQLRIWAA
jgi:hypothetical protein